MFSISAPKRQRRRALAMALTKVPAGEGAAHGILVNFLHVGLIDSDQWVQRHTFESAPAIHHVLSAHVLFPVPEHEYTFSRSRAAPMCLAQALAVALASRQSSKDEPRIPTVAGSSPSVDEIRLCEFRAPTA